MLLDDLYKGTPHRFADWPNDDAVPLVSAGVYTIWRDEEFLYVGMAGKKITSEHIDSPDEPVKAKGLKERLKSHWNGRRSGDQFCVYVCDRFVVPTLTAPERKQIGNATLLLDTMTKKYIHKYLAYRFTPTPDGQTALELEERIRRGAWPRGDKPFLNPKQPKEPSKPSKPRMPKPPG